MNGQIQKFYQTHQLPVEIKKDLVRVLEHLPEEQLTSALEYLKTGSSRILDSTYEISPLDLIQIQLLREDYREFFNSTDELEGIHINCYTNRIERSLEKELKI